MSKTKLSEDFQVRATTLGPPRVTGNEAVADRMAEVARKLADRKARVKGDKAVTSHPTKKFDLYRFLGRYKISLGAWSTRPGRDLVTIFWLGGWSLP